MVVSARLMFGFELDCIKGERHERGCDPDYDRGYAARYELEQLQRNVWFQEYLSHNSKLSGAR